MLKKKFYGFVVAVAAFFFLATTNSFDYKIVGYYPSWAIYNTPPFEPTELDFHLITHINYAFAGVKPNGEIELGDPWADIEYFPKGSTPGEYQEGAEGYAGNFMALYHIKQKWPDLKILISIGSEAFSKSFSPMANDPIARTNFVKNAIQFSKQYHFDGIDIDWEFPGAQGNEEGIRDKENFTLLMAELYHAAKDEETPLLVSIAAPATPAHYMNIEISKIHNYVDWINLMAYDFHGPDMNSDNFITNHQAPLYSSKAGNQELNVDSAVRYYLEQGVPSRKLVLGISLEGHAYANASGLFTSYEGAAAGLDDTGMRPFSQIAEDLSVSDLHWDNISKVPYLYNSTNREFVTFENEKSIISKAQYVKQQALGGVMIWELSLDTPSKAALNIIYKSL